MTKKKTEDVVQSKCVDTECAVATEHVAHIGTPAPTARAVPSATTEPEFKPSVRDTKTMLLASVEDLHQLQHTRAAAGGGQSIPWQNARAHIAKAIECIEQQTAADASK